MSTEKSTGKKFSYRVPSVIKHKATKDVMKGVLAELTERGMALTNADIPFLNRLATSYDRYWDAVEFLSKKEPIVINKKGEEVKHPMVNIEKEAWTQYLTVAKEYGLTVASGVKIKAKQPVEKEDADAPIKKYIHRN